ncbi:hypothetical protein PRIC1_006580 [Phytophthora ramorum]
MAELATDATDAGNASDGSTDARMEVEEKMAVDAGNESDDSDVTRMDENELAIDAAVAAIAQEDSSNPLTEVEETMEDDANASNGGNAVEVEEKMVVDVSAAQESSPGTRMADDEAPNTDARTEDEVLSDAADAASPLDDGRNPLVAGVVPATASHDLHIKMLINVTGGHYLYFNQWKSKMNNKSAPTRLRVALEQLLPRLMGARDYAGASKVLSVMYHRFAVSPAMFIEASLEILRRQPDYREDLLGFYDAALATPHIDKLSIMKEMWLFHMIHGEFYEAYHLYQDKIQQTEEAESDPRVLANFGILCYWLIFIESKEIRELLKREDLADEEEEDDDMEPAAGNELDASESVESVIEANYLFKTPIGVHILYQHASNALRRAVAHSPKSALFVEHYVQLLTLVGDIQPACDFLEAFFHMNPNDPHGARMLAGFLENYYPDSLDAKVAVYIRWMKNDPSCSYALDKLLELSSAGAVSSFVLTNVLVEALDTCGSDSYVVQSPQIALDLWRNLAELLSAMDEDEFLLAQVEGEEMDPLQQATIADVGAQHVWWKRIYFARPSTMEEVAALSKCDGNFMEVSIYRAAAAERLFPGFRAMADALCCAMASPDITFSQEHGRLLKSFFPSFSRRKPEQIVHTPFIKMPFIHATVRDEKRNNPPLPVFRGSLDTLQVIDRKLIVEREATGDKADVVVTRTGERQEINSEFVQELYEALECEVGHSSSSSRKRKADVISTSAPPVSIPGYVGMIEEEVYSNPDAVLVHIYSVIYQKLRRSDMLLPTIQVVEYWVAFFRERIHKSQLVYGNCGLLVRYEEFIATHVRRQRDKDTFRVTRDAAKAAIEEMKRVLPSPHPHFPAIKLVKQTMRAKSGIFTRLRRLRLMEIKKSMKSVLKKLVYVDDKVFVDAAYAVCQQNGLLGVVTRLDLARSLQSILPGHYYGVLLRIQPQSIRLLTSSAVRKDCTTPEEILESARRHRSPRTLDEIKALLWVERYEAFDDTGDNQVLED